MTKKDYQLLALAMVELTPDQMDDNYVWQLISGMANQSKDEAFKSLMVIAFNLGNTIKRGELHNLAVTPEQNRRRAFCFSCGSPWEDHNPKTHACPEHLAPIVGEHAKIEQSKLIRDLDDTKQGVNYRRLAQEIRFGCLQTEAHPQPTW